MGSSVPINCGNSSMYCPAGAIAPLPVGPGYYSDGLEGAKSVRLQCGLGRYCTGDGTRRDCPPGFYGSVPGLTNATCSGRCSDGALCAAGSTSAAGQPCPAGSVCTQGLAVPCPLGAYNNGTGGSDLLTACTLCPTGTYGPTLGASALTQCLPCAPHESSNPGAVACWPGVLGKCPLRPVDHAVLVHTALNMEFTCAAAGVFVRRWGGVVATCGAER
jgi:hypothetical protein